MKPIPLLIATVLLLSLPGPAKAEAQVKPETLAGWREYVAATEARRETEARNGSRFLVLDFGSAPGEERKAVLAGGVRIEPMRTRSAQGDAIEIPSGLVHHWRGAVFVPGLTAAALIDRLKQAPPPQEDVIRSSVISRGPESMQVALRLRRTRIVTVVYDTVHDVTFTRRTPRRSESASVMTRLLELESPDTPQERARPEGTDRGFLWRLNSYWRYEEVAGGVIAECESVSLSRGVPFGLRTITGPLISGIARESMEAALKALVPLGGAGARAAIGSGDQGTSACCGTRRGSSLAR